MRKSKLLKINFIFIFLFICVLLSNSVVSDNLEKNQNIISYESKSDNFAILYQIQNKYSPRASYDVIGSIVIDATLSTFNSTSGNWLWAEQQDWCSGSGLEKDPYIISNIKTTSFTVVNSHTVYFKFFQCDISTEIQAQNLILINCSKGTISNNDISGIKIDICSEIMIENNLFLNSENIMLNSERLYIYNNSFQFSNEASSRLIFFNTQKSEIIDNEICGGSQATIQLTSESSFNIIRDNIIIGNPTYSKSDSDIPNGIINENSNNNDLHINTISNLKNALININSNFTSIVGNSFFNCQIYGIYLNNSASIYVASDNQFSGISVQNIYPEIEYDTFFDILTIQDEDSSPSGGDDEPYDDNDSGSDYPDIPSSDNPGDDDDNMIDYPPGFFDNSTTDGIENDNQANEENSDSNSSTDNPNENNEGENNSYVDEINDVFKEIQANNIYMILVSTSVVVITFILINGFVKTFDDE